MIVLEHLRIVTSERGTIKLNNHHLPQLLIETHVLDNVAGNIAIGRQRVASCRLLYPLSSRTAQAPRENYNRSRDYIPLKRTHSGFAAGTSGPAAPLGWGNAA